MNVHLPSCFVLMNIKSLAPETGSIVLQNMSLPIHTEKLM